MIAVAISRTCWYLSLHKNGILEGSSRNYLLWSSISICCSWMHSFGIIINWILEGLALIWSKRVDGIFTINFQVSKRTRCIPYVYFILATTIFDVLYYVMRYQILFITESHNLLGSSWILNRADLYMSIHVLCYMCVSLCFSFCAFFHSFVFEIGWTCVILGYANKEFEFEHLDLI